MKILIIASRFPFPLEKGDKLRLFHQIKELSKHHELALFATTDRRIKPEDMDAVRSYCNSVTCHYRSKWTICKNLMLALFSDLPFQVAYFYDRSIKSELERYIASEKPDHLYCQLIRTAVYAEGIEMNKTLDYMDNFSKWSRKLASHSSFFLKRWFFQREAKRVAAYEAQVYPEFDHHTIISKQDAMAMPFPEKGNITCVPNGVDTEFFSPKPETDIKFTVSFVGNLGYYNNVEAARYIVQRIMPEVWKQDSSANLLLAGARPASKVLQLSGERVVVSGWMDDIRDAYAGASIFVAPLFLAVGQQNKILEAMAMGVPCVTTPQVNNAIGAIDGESVLLADSPGSFARRINQLVEDPAYRDRIGKNGLAFVRKKYSWRNAVQPLIDILSDE